MQFYRRFTLVLALLLGVLTIASAQKSSKNVEKKASISFEKTQLDMGTFPKSAGPQTVVFNFKNVGNDKLVFYDGGGDCGCIKVEYPDKPVKPGKKGKIYVTFNGYNIRPGRFNHKIYFAVSGRPTHFTLRVVGEMTKN